MQVRPPDHVVLALRIQNERLDLFASFGQRREVGQQVHGAGQRNAVGVDGFVRLGFGHVTHLSFGPSLDEGQDARVQQRRIGPAVRSGPLLRRRVKAPGQMVPGETVKILRQTPALGVFDVGQDAGQLADGHNGVLGAVVLAE